MKCTSVIVYFLCCSQTKVRFVISGQIVSANEVSGIIGQANREYGMMVKQKEAQLLHISENVL